MSSEERKGATRSRVPDGAEERRTSASGDSSNVSDAPPEGAATIEWRDFERVELRAGTVIAVEDFPEARKPAWKLTIDFGASIGTRRSSAQITDLYAREDLLGRQVVAVVNFPPRRIGPFLSECLVTGLHREDGAVVLIGPDEAVSDGARLC